MFRDTEYIDVKKKKKWEDSLCRLPDLGRPVESMTKKPISPWIYKEKIDIAY
jgi:hypothetical protein